MTPLSLDVITEPRNYGAIWHQRGCGLPTM